MWRTDLIGDAPTAVKSTIGTELERLAFLYCSPWPACKKCETWPCLMHASARLQTSSSPICILPSQWNVKLDKCELTWVCLSLRWVDEPCPSVRVLCWWIFLWNMLVHCRCTWWNQIYDQYFFGVCMEMVCMSWVTGQHSFAWQTPTSVCATDTVTGNWLFWLSLWPKPVQGWLQPLGFPYNQSDAKAWLDWCTQLQ